MGRTELPCEAEDGRGEEFAGHTWNGKGLCPLGTSGGRRYRSELGVTSKSTDGGVVFSGSGKKFVWGNNSNFFAGGIA